MNVKTETKADVKVEEKVAVLSNEGKQAVAELNQVATAETTYKFTDADKQLVEEAMLLLGKPNAGDVLGNVELPVISKAASMLNDYYNANKTKARKQNFELQLKAARDLGDAELIEFYTNALANIEKGRSLIATSKETSSKPRKKTVLTSENCRIYDKDGVLTVKGTQGRASDKYGALLTYDVACQKYTKQVVDKAIEEANK